MGNNPINRVDPSGLKDLILIGSPGTATPNNKNFVLGARTLQKRVCGGKADVVYPYGEGLTGDAAKQRVLQALKSSYDNIYYLGHGSESGIWLAPKVAFGVKDFAGARFKEATFYGCNLGERGAFAEQLATQNKATVNAISGTAQFSGYRNGWADDGFVDKNGRSFRSNDTPLTEDYPGDVWGVPAHPMLGDSWERYPRPVDPYGNGPHPRGRDR